MAMARPVNRLREFVIVVAQLGLAVWWLMSGVVYVFTPPGMARALAMSDMVRVSLGLTMTALALLLLVGIVARGRPVIATIGTVALAMTAIAFSIYDVVRHWTTFALFDTALAAVAIALLVVRVVWR